MSRLRTLTILVIAFHLVPLSASARAQQSASPHAETTARAMSLGDAIAYARTHQPAVLAGIARVRASEAAANIPRAQWKPRIGVTGQLFGATANNTTGTYAGTSFLDIPRIGATRATGSGTWQPYASTFVGAGIEQEVFDFGRIAAQSAAADALADVQRQAAQSALLDVTYDVEEAYFAVFAAKSVLQSSEDAYERSRVHRDLAKAGVDSGLRSPIELTRAEADLSRFDTGRIRARGGVETSESVYAAAVGVPDLELDVAGTSQQPPDMPDLQVAIARAEASDPRIRQLIAQLRADEQRTRAIGAELRPDFSATGTVSGRAGGAPPSSGDAATGSGWIPGVSNWDVGIVFSWPLFDPVVSAREHAAHSQEQVRREELAQARFDDVAAIREGYVKVQVARACLPSLQQSVTAARANYAQADARFKAGLGTAVELADAEALRADAEIQVALGIFEIARTRAVFGRTIAEGISP